MFLVNVPVQKGRGPPGPLRGFAGSPASWMEALGACSIAGRWETVKEEVPPDATDLRYLIKQLPLRGATSSEFPRVCSLDPSKAT